MYESVVDSCSDAEQNVAFSSESAIVNKVAEGRIRRYRSLPTLLSYLSPALYARLYPGLKHRPIRANCITVQRGKKRVTQVKRVKSENSLSSRLIYRGI